MYDLGGRAVVALIAILAVGLVALPSTVSLFAGQHWWYNVDNTGNDIPCDKCHADVFQEFKLNVQNNGAHSSFVTNTANPTNDEIRKACGYCHRGVPGITYAVGDGTGFMAGKEAHAASTMGCMACHEWNSGYTSPSSAPQAGGFNVTAYLSGYSRYDYGANNGTWEAHNAFIVEAIKDTNLTDSNEACIACHTHVAVKIKWKHYRTIEFDLNVGNPRYIDIGSGQTPNWTISNWNIGNITVTPTVFGNVSGNGSTSYDAANWPGSIGQIYQ
ncbi:multiheme c-type cytochrome [Geoglobus sp.]